MSGMVTALQTFGELAHWHPHVHALVTDGALDAAGHFEPLPEVPAGVFTEVWRTKIFALLRQAGCINSRAVWAMRSWKHSGFSAPTGALSAGPMGSGWASEHLVGCRPAYGQLLPPAGAMLWTSCAACGLWYSLCHSVLA
jgi:hypothetical protein